MLIDRMIIREYNTPNRKMLPLMIYEQLGILRNEKHIKNRWENIHPEWKTLGWTKEEDMELLQHVRDNGCTWSKLNASSNSKRCPDKFKERFLTLGRVFNLHEAILRGEEIETSRGQIAKNSKRKILQLIEWRQSQQLLLTRGDIPARQPPDTCSQISSDFACDNSGFDAEIAKLVMENDPDKIEKFFAEHESSVSCGEREP